MLQCVAILQIALTALPVISPATRPAPANEPASRPSLQKYDVFIQLLVERDPDIRSNAAERLREQGADALPALRRSLIEGPDDIRAAACPILLDIYRAVHEADRGRDNPDDPRLLVDYTDSPIHRAEIRDAGKHILITESTDRVHVLLELGAGDNITRSEYNAPDVKSLASTQPAGYRVYRTWVGEPGHEWQLKGKWTDVLSLPPALRGRHSDDIGGLRTRLERAMGAMDIKLGDRMQVMRLLLEMSQSSDALDLAPNRSREMNEAGARYFDRCDALREKLAELHLPDPGTDLPGPRGQRLGISTTLGIPQVIWINPHDRADQLGIRVNDQILTVNGEFAPGMYTIRRELRCASGPITVEVIRDNRLIVLREE